MPYSIITKDGIKINGIPDDLPRDSDVLKQRVAAARQQRQSMTAAPAQEPAATGTVDVRLAGADDPSTYANLPSLQASGGQEQAVAPAPMQQVQSDPTQEPNAYQGPVAETVRQVGRTGRALASGIAGIADIPAGAVKSAAYYLGQGARKIGADSIAGGAGTVANMTLPSESTSAYIDALTGGKLSPRDGGERISDAALQATAPGVGLAGLAGKATSMAPAALSALRALGVGTTPELVGGAAAGAAGQYTAEKGGGAGEALGASLLAGLGGAAATAVPGQIGRGIASLPLPGKNGARARADSYLNALLQEADVSKDALGARSEAMSKATGGQDLPLSALTDNYAIENSVRSVAQTGGTGAIAAAGRSVKDIESALKKKQNSFLNEVSKNAGTPEELAGSFKAGAEAIRDRRIALKRDRANKAYGAVVKVGNAVPENELEGLLSYPFRSGQSNTALTETMRQVEGNKDVSFGQSPKTVDKDTGLFDESGKPIKRTVTIEGKEPFIPRNSLPFLDQVYHRFVTRIEQDMAKGADVGPLIDAKNALGKLIEKHHPQYREAVDIYSGDSRLLDSTFGEGNKRTALGKIVAMLPEKGINAAHELFKQSPDEIVKIKQEFAKEGMSSNFDDATKAFMTDDLERSANPSPDVAKTNKSELDKRKIRAAIGPERAAAFFEALDVAKALAQSRKALAGAQTGSNVALNEARKEAAKTPRSVAVKTIGTAAKVAGFVVPDFLMPRRLAALGESDITLLGGQQDNPEFHKRLVDVLFDPKTSKEFLEGMRSNVPEDRVFWIRRLWRMADANIRSSAAKQKSAEANPSSPQPARGVDYKRLNLNALGAGARAEQQTQERK